ncbi:phosphate/phosphite/phosphonate ABC transporter substrate-binding protein [Crocosphaera chwakensis]|uniref:Phosphonate-binding periplasmic protein n=1 Tax=Crocosphaera chwakensis CCY0110 TaxID=391612 RepID=A3IUL5_9CHRO|nr:phosphate/phosphite/phosphonate ABC transporter substrate-binding protein [Crocosphaera chwakensis]EAZ89807.1 Phosphonate-binding periplasmic protein [Crocosphaera chwakensis CCY0110]
MKRRNLLVYSLLFLVGCSGASINSSTNANREPDTLRFAVTDVQGLEELQRDYEPFRDALAETLNKEIEFFPVADRTAAAVALQSDQVDIVLTGPAEYVVMQAKTEAVPFIAITRPNYRSVIAVHKNSGIKSLNDLKGKTIAMSDLGSTSGQLGPTKILVDAGLQPEKDIYIKMLGDADLQAFRNEDVEAWGGAALDYDRFMQAKSLKSEEYPIIETGDLLPSDVFIASNKLKPEYVEEIKERMVENQDQLIAAIVSVSANEKYKGSTLVEAKDSDYDPIREAYQAIGVNDFTEFVGN